jgi:phosphoribosylamine---glycine ligase
MNILILGSGGREHALAWRLAQDPSVGRVLVWPGNPGMELGDRPKLACLQLPFNRENLKEIIEIHHVQLVVPGAEKYLYQGVADWCEQLHVPCLGPGAQAAALERSKLFSKDVMLKARVPTAAYADLTDAYHADPISLKNILEKFRRPVIKLSGPSLGKGVFVCANPAEALTTIEELKRNPMQGIEEGIFVEEGLSGREISLFFACHGEKYLYLGAAQDHKRLLDNDQGPNTGGMGTISPVSWADDRFLAQVEALILRPTLQHMAERGIPFKGILFLGLMVEGEKINLLEYNVRFGDPETQALMPLIQGDLAQALMALLQSEPQLPQLSFKNKFSVHVVKAAKGYPGLFGAPIEKGQKIELNISDDTETHFFFAGVRREQQSLVSDGGRVLGVTALGDSPANARLLVYQKVKEASFAGEHFRQDIGVQA